MLIGKDARTRLPRNGVKLCDNAKVWQCAFKARELAGLKYLPQGQTLYNKTYLFVPFFFQKKYSKFTLMHQTQHFRKINPEPFLALPYASK